MEVEREVLSASRYGGTEEFCRVNSSTHEGAILREGLQPKLLSSIIERLKRRNEEVVRKADIEPYSVNNAPSHSYLSLEGLEYESQANTPPALCCEDPRITNDCQASGNLANQKPRVKLSACLNRADHQNPISLDHISSTSLKGIKVKNAEMSGAPTAEVTASPAIRDRVENKPSKFIHSDTMEIVTKDIQPGADLKRLPTCMNRLEQNSLKSILNHPIATTLRFSLAEYKEFKENKQISGVSLHSILVPENKMKTYNYKAERQPSTNYKRVSFATNTLYFIYSH